MTDECPGFDRDRGVCLLRAEDCELAPAGRDADTVFESPEPPVSDASAEARSG